MSARGLSKYFGNVPALKDVSLDVNQGEFVCILGPSGCGKTTLLRLIAGLETATSGTLVLNGRDITDALPSQRHCGVVFQSYALFPNLTAFQNIAYGLRGLSRKERDDRVRRWLEWVGLSECADRRPAQLSGGQQQRVALARALAPEPSVLLLDEPLSALDAKVRHYLRTQVLKIQRQLGITTIMVTHDQLEAMTMAERVVVVKDGNILQVGAPAELYRHPCDPFVADFLGSMNFIAATIDDTTTVNCLGHTMRCDQALPGKKGDKVLLAIRPEDIRIVDPGETNRLPVRLELREFRGSHFRFQFALADSHAGAPPLILEADVQTHEVDMLPIEDGGSVSIQLPAGCLLAFPETED